MSRDWSAFWGAQDDPRHPRDNPNFFSEHGRELSIVVGDAAGKRVLEFGCGGGSMMEPLGFDRASSYRGVDFSEQMLSVFRSRRPNADLVCADATSYRDSSSYDIIFSNAVVQYFDRTMFRRHVENARMMLAPDGTLIIGSVLWRGARRAFYMNAYRSHMAHNRLRETASYARSLVSIGSIGRWYSLGEVEDAADANGLSAIVFGSVMYPYRFHVRLKIAR